MKNGKEGIIISINGSRREEFLRFCEKLNKKAKKHAVDNFSVVFIGERIVDVQNKPSFKTLVLDYQITIPVFKINGWILAGTSTRTEGGNIITSFYENLPVPERFRETTRCDHCQTKRNRTYTCILLGDYGEWKQVGSGCVKDFIGHSVEAWDFLCHLSSSFRNFAKEDSAGSCESSLVWDLKGVLALTFAVLRNNPYVSKKMSEETYSQSTASLVVDLLHHKGNKPEVNEEDLSKAEKTAEWMAAGGDTEYLRNLRVISSCGYVTAHTVGRVVSAADSWRRQSVGSKIGSRHIGEVGQKIEIQDAVVVSCRMVDGPWGPNPLLCLEKDGNMFSVFYKDKIKEGSTVSFKALVKRHSLFRGLPCTDLTRMKITGPSNPHQT